MNVAWRNCTVQQCPVLQTAITGDVTTLDDPEFGTVDELCRRLMWKVRGTQGWQAIEMIRECNSCESQVVLAFAEFGEARDQRC